LAVRADEVDRTGRRDRLLGGRGEDLPDERVELAHLGERRPGGRQGGEQAGPQLGGVGRAPRVVDGADQRRRVVVVHGVVDDGDVDAVVRGAGDHAEDSHRFPSFFGSRASRRPSPRRLRPTTRRTTTAPGAAMVHQAVVTRERASRTIDPSDGVGGGVPSPRKLSDASVSTAQDRDRVTWTMTIAVMLGSTWRRRIRDVGNPRTVPARTNSASRSERTGPRVTRTKIGV